MRKNTREEKVQLEEKFSWLRKVCEEKVQLEEKVFVAEESLAGEFV